MGGTGRPLGKTFFLRCQRRHPELPKIPTYLPLCSMNFRKLMRGSRSTNGASAYGSTSRTSRTSSRPPPSQASPSNDEINDAADVDGDGAEAPLRSTSARRCRSVASAPARRSGSLHPFQRRTPARRRTPEVRKAKEASHRREAKKVGPPAGPPAGPPVVESLCQETRQPWKCSNKP